MAKPIPNPAPQRRNTGDGGSAAGPAEAASRVAPSRPVVPVPAELDIWSTDDSLRQEMERLASENKQMIAGLEGNELSEQVARLQAENEELRGQVAELRQNAATTDQSEELAQFQAENEELRKQIEELTRHLEASSQGEEAWAARQKEFEDLLEQKSEVIRNLHLKVQDLESQPAPAPAISQPASTTDISEDDLHSMAEELERERQELEEARRQLEEDERTMMQQMRDMEMQMARERAELARQRNELQRLHSDIRHELERAKKDDGLGERLRMLQRRHAEVTGRRPPESAPAPGDAPLPPEDAGGGQPPPGTPPPRKPRDSGLLRRLFGKGN